MLEPLIALAGFSTGISALLMLGLATIWRGLPLPLVAKLGGFAMLVCLVATSWQHVAMARSPHLVEAPALYGSLLFVQTLGFYLLLRGALQRDGSRPLWDVLLAGSMLGLAFGLPSAWRVPAAMLAGAAAAAHLAWLLWQLRMARRWFRLELPVVVLFAAMSLVVAVAGMLAPERVSWPQFGLLYSAQIAIGFALVTALLVVVPDLVEKTREAVAASHAATTLGRVDVPGVVAEVRRLFEQDHVYRDESLSLSSLAALVSLSTHQLSELINQHFGTGFSRLVRSYRVTAAKRMLIDEPRASVLSVGLSVGFGAQSTFYVAFKDEVGMVPGEFRKRHQAGTASE